VDAILQAVWRTDLIGRILALEDIGGSARVQRHYGFVEANIGGGIIDGSMEE
jgi:hypothetical protein